MPRGDWRKEHLSTSPDVGEEGGSHLRYLPHCQRGRPDPHVLHLALDCRLFHMVQQFRHLGGRSGSRGSGWREGVTPVKSFGAAAKVG